MKKLILIFACMSILNFGDALWAQDNASDSADIGSGTQKASALERDGQTIDDAADQREQEEDFYANPANVRFRGYSDPDNDPASAPIPGDE